MSNQKLFYLIEKELTDEVPLALWKGQKHIITSFQLTQRFTSLQLTLAHLAAIKGNLDALIALQKNGDSFQLPDARLFLPAHHAAFHCDPHLDAFFSRFANTVVEGTTELTPLRIQKLVHPNHKNYWSSEALYFSVNAAQNHNPSLQKELQAYEECTRFEEKGEIPTRLVLKASAEIGQDVVANERIEENSVMGTYDGMVTIGRKRVSAYAHGSVLTTPIGDLVIDAMHHRSMGSLFNDSAPNIYKEIFTDQRDGLPRIVFKSLRVIEPGESITWNYGPNHIIKYGYHLELQKPFLTTFCKELCERAKCRTWRQTVLSDQYHLSLDTRREVEVFLYLDETLHSLVWAAASGLLEEIHFAWMLALVSTHQESSHPSFSEIVRSWLQRSPEGERKYLLERLPFLYRHELLHILNKGAASYQARIKSWLMLKCLKGMSYVAHAEKGYAAVALSKLLLYEKRKK